MLPLALSYFRSPENWIKSKERRFTFLVLVGIEPGSSSVETKVHFNGDQEKAGGIVQLVAHFFMVQRVGDSYLGEVKQLILYVSLV